MSPLEIFSNSTQKSNTLGVDRIYKKNSLINYHTQKNRTNKYLT